MNKNKPLIALLLGGTSPEKEVSKSSAASVYKALLALGYRVKLINPAYGINQPLRTEDFFAEQEFSEISNRNFIAAVNSSLFDDVDLAFLTLHGKWGEDGSIQSLLELRGIKYTGSKILSSAVAMDKAMSKILFKEYEVETPKGFLIENHSIDIESVSKKIENEFGFPVAVKPNDQGSTVGLTICNEKSKLSESLNIAFKFAKHVLIEEYISGRELTVAVLDGEALPPLEIKPKSGFYDYESKYTTGLTEYEVPAKVSDEITATLKQQALLAFKALHCDGYARVDFRMNEQNKIYCLEVNTLPGMTATSLVPKMAKVVGISFEQLVEKIIQLGLR
ncbi:MAG TPA: D-alanine--D-alanine ligase [Ignavibacteriaceae bacterium]|nr:D-alanine--D-alanine ligase [Ignavibacteriaceae bacterium]